MTVDQPKAADSRHVKLVRIWLRWFREPLLSVLLTVQIVILFVMPAMRAIGIPVPQIAVSSVLAAFVMLACIVARSRGAVIFMLISVVLTVIGGIWRHTLPDTGTDLVSATGQVLAQVTLLYIVSTAVFGPGPTTPHRILGAVVMYLGIGMVFTTLYILLAETTANAFHAVPTDSVAMRETLTYFSFSTLTTSSYGDIFPVHPVARSLANLEAVCGQLFPATLLARIVGLHHLTTTKTGPP